MAPRRSIEVVLLDREKDGGHCLNCDTILKGRYCHACGQNISTARITFKNILLDLPARLFSIDRGVLRNIAGMWRPHRTVRRYLAGRRTGFIDPMIYFFVSLGLIMYIESITGKAISIEMDFALELEGDPFNASPFLNEYLKYIYFSFAFLAAIPNQWLFGRTTGTYLAEQVIASTFVLGWVNTIYLAIIWLPQVNSYPSNLFFLVLFASFTFLVQDHHPRLKGALSTIISVLIAFMLFLSSAFLLWGIGWLFHSV